MDSVRYPNVVNKAKRNMKQPLVRLAAAGAHTGKGLSNSLDDIQNKHLKQHGSRICLEFRDVLTLHLLWTLKGPLWLAG